MQRGQEKAEEERRIRGRKKGKGWGGSQLPKEKEGKEKEESEEREKGKEEEKEGPPWRRQRGVIKLGLGKQSEQCVELLRVKQPSCPVAEEEQGGAWCSPEDAGQACEGDPGSVDTEESKDITRGVKLSSYFSLMLRPYYSTSSRDMKELFHLANCVDQLRSGQLGLLGDSLASRFLAIHCAMVEGTWKSAQYLELNPLDAPTSAPTPVLLEAKRHAKLIYKSQSHESYKKNSEWDWKGGEERKGKGKQKGKKGGKGKWRSGNGRGDWDNWQKDSWWERNRDKKDGKDAKEDAKEKK